MLPRMRLGSGAEDTPQSMSALKNHPWFTKCVPKKKGHSVKDDSAAKIVGDVTEFYGLPVPQWPKQYKMKYICDRLERYYNGQSFSRSGSAPAKGRDNGGGSLHGALDLEDSIKNVRHTRMS